VASRSFGVSPPPCGNEQRTIAFIAVHPPGMDRTASKISDASMVLSLLPLKATSQGRSSSRKSRRRKVLKKHPSSRRWEYERPGLYFQVMSTR
jgi:hypothetical protein